MLQLLAAVTDVVPPPTAPDSESMFPWYNYLIIAGIVVILLAYKAYKNKTMT